MNISGVIHIAISSKEDKRLKLNNDFQMLEKHVKAVVVEQTSFRTGNVMGTFEVRSTAEAAFPFRLKIKSCHVSRELLQHESMHVTLFF